MDNEIIVRGCASTAITTLGVVTSFQEQFLWWLRVSSLMVGLAVGILTILGFVRRFRAESNQQREGRYENDNQ